MSGTVHFEKHDYPRACDICAHRWNNSQLRSIGYAKKACPDCYPGIHQKAYELRQRSLRVPIPKPRRDYRPTVEKPNYQLDEAAVFNFVTQTAPYRYFDVTSGAGALYGGASVEATGEAIRYLCDLIAENRRPRIWLAVARSTVATLSDWLLTQQISWPAVGYGFPDDDLGSNFANTATSACAGIALLRAYQLLGDSRYLTAGRNVAGFLRAMQCSGWLNINFTSEDAAGATPWHRGGMLHVIDSHANAPNHRFYPGDLIALEYLTLLLSIVGDVTATASGAMAFSQSTTAPLSQMIAELRAFWLTEATGFQTATAAEYLDAYPTGTGAWAYASGTSITGRNWARALRSLASTDGVTSADAATRYAWMTSFTGYDTMAPATLLDVSTKQAGSTLYDWGAAGAMAALQSQAAGGSMVAARDRLTRPFYRNASALGAQSAADPKLAGQSTLAFDMSQTPIRYDVVAASMIGSFYRQSPQSFPMQA